MVEISQNFVAFSEYINFIDNRQGLELRIFFMQAQRLRQFYFLLAACIRTARITINDIIDI